MTLANYSVVVSLALSISWLLSCGDDASNKRGKLRNSNQMVEEPKDAEQMDHNHDHSSGQSFPNWPANKRIEVSWQVVNADNMQSYRLYVGLKSDTKRSQIKDFVTENLDIVGGKAVGQIEVKNNASLAGFENKETCFTISAISSGGESAQSDIACVTLSHDEKSDH